MKRRLTEGTPGFVSIVAMVETVWVLDRVYGLSAHKIAAAVVRWVNLTKDLRVRATPDEMLKAARALH
jgi:predicted nucleic-acid-binding protein